MLKRLLEVAILNYYQRLTYLSIFVGNLEIPHICHGIEIQEGTDQRNSSCLFVIFHGYRALR